VPLETGPSRTFLFVPGSRPDRFAKAVASGADEVILDLEDALKPEEKDEARKTVSKYLREEKALVRINAVGSSWFQDDLAELSRSPGLKGIVLPKTESVEDVVLLRLQVPIDVRIYALIESAQGIANALDIARDSDISGFMFGNLDFALDIGATASDEGETELLFARSALVIASRSARLPGPIDGVQPRVDDDVATSTSAKRAVNLGFSGKLCLHPRQVAIVHDAFEPTAESLEWANEVLIQASHTRSGVLRVGEEMIDLPQLERARQIISRRTREPSQ
jgi:citrate lyase subunit beta / citryl-CoA lyase